MLIGMWKVLNSIGYQGITNGNYNEIPLHTHPNSKSNNSNNSKYRLGNRQTNWWWICELAELICETVFIIWWSWKWA